MDYLKLYGLQDSIIRAVMEPDNYFYLTGGTAIHRFYYNARYSEDLDFFVTDSVTFHEDIRDILETLKAGHRVSVTVRSRDFYRLDVDGLKVDFVNDRVFRHGKSRIIEGVRVDNIVNILTNKLGAIMSRDEPKDVFDIFCIALNERFNWNEVLHIADRKTPVPRDALIYRLRTFPLKALEKVNTIRNIPIGARQMERLTADILKGCENSLFRDMEP